MGNKISNSFSSHELEFDIRISRATNDGKCFAEVEVAFLHRLIEAVKSQLPRPISEAPKDGTHFDLITPTGERITDCYYHISGRFYDKHGRLNYDITKSEFEKSKWFQIPGGKAVS